MSEYPETLGLVLAGGLSRRMGSPDKGLRDIGGRSILQRVVDTLRPQCREVILSANGELGRFAAFGLEVVADDLPGFPGPLAGILAGLDWTARHRPEVDWVASMAGDTPFAPSDYVRRLHRAREQAGAALASAASGDRTHPVNGIWPVALRDDLRDALARGDRKVGLWTARHGAAVARWDETPDPFFNVNRPEDLEEARRLASFGPEGR